MYACYNKFKNKYRDYKKEFSLSTSPLVSPEITTVNILLCVLRRHSVLYRSSDYKCILFWI